MEVMRQESQHRLCGPFEATGTVRDLGLATADDWRTRIQQHLLDTENGHHNNGNNGNNKEQEQQQD